MKPMTPKSPIRVAIIPAIVALAGAACSSSGSQSREAQVSTDASAGEGTVGSDAGSSQRPSPDPVSGGSSVSDNPSASVPENAVLVVVDPAQPGTGRTTTGEVEVECARTAATSEVVPAAVFIALDRSGSMQRNGRWLPAVKALRTFFSDDRSTGIVASLTLFPASRGVGGDASDCLAETYATPDVGPLALPDVAPFTDALLANPSSVSRTTPALSAMTGLIEQAEAAQAQDPDRRTFMILLSDGAADECGVALEDTIENVTSTLEEVAERLPTYVVGLGVELESLHQVAEAGGTGSAVLINTEFPEIAGERLLERLEEIRREVIPCEVPIPVPPDRQEFDPLKVETRIRTEADGNVDIPFEPNCETGSGWRYDNFDDPSAIFLCDSACRRAQQPGAELEVVFGCAVNPGIVR